jgi:hypothetical protein
MKCEAMVLNDPVVIVGDLKRIGAKAPSPKNQVRRIEWDEEAESPSKVDPEVFPIGELIPSDDSTIG